jgi:hypothetical protein
LEPGDSREFEAEVRAVDSNPRSQVIMTARTAENAEANDSYTFEIARPLNSGFGQGANGSAGGNIGGSGLVPPSLPPETAPPTIPGGAAPIPDPNAGAGGQVPVGPPANGLPTTPRRTNQLQLSLVPRDNPVQINQPIRYTLRVQNDTDVVDGPVSLRFELPPGVKMERIVQRRSPELGQFQVNAGIVEMADIRTMRPGETIDYELVLSSNQPQTFTLMVEGATRQTRNIARTTAETTVIP